jgi:hypothetical protein
LPDARPDFPDLPLTFHLIFFLPLVSIFHRTHTLAQWGGSGRGVRGNLLCLTVCLSSWLVDLPSPLTVSGTQVPG